MKRIVPLLALMAVPVWTEPTYITIDDAVRVAVAAHPDLKSAELERNAAARDLATAKTQMLPTLSASSALTHYGDPASMSFMGQSFRVGAEDEFSLTGRIDQSVYSGGRVGTQIDQARVLSDITKLNLRALRLKVIAEARNACYEVIRYESLLKAAEQSVAAAKAHRSDAEARVRAGVSAGIEVIRADVRIKEAELEEVSRRNSLELARSNLAILLDMPSVTRLEVRGEFPDAGIQRPLDEPERYALISRPDLAAANAEARAEELGIVIARSKYFPEVNAFGAWTVKDDDLTRKDESWRIGLTASWEIFNWGRTTNGVRAAEYRTGSARERARAKERAVKSEVREAELAVASARESVRLATARRAAALEDLRISKLRFGEGVGIGTEVIDAESAVAAADAQEINARADLAAAINRFWLVTGGDNL